MWLSWADAVRAHTWVQVAVGGLIEAILGSFATLGKLSVPWWLRQ